MAYRVRDWPKNFENHKTKILKTMTWIPVPVKLGGDGYSELIDHPNGAAHFGCWIAILEVAAACDPRGSLVRGAGAPHDVASLARTCRIPAQLMQQAVDRLVSIGWLETWHISAGSAPESGVEAAPKRQIEDDEGRKEGRSEGRSVDRTEDRNTGGAEAPSDGSATAAPPPAEDEAPNAAPGELSLDEINHRRKLAGLQPRTPAEHDRRQAEDRA